jgi:hypothetical protein
MFEIDFEILVSYLTPKFLRQPRLLAWARVLLSQVKAVYDLFVVYRASSNYRAAHNSQTCFLRKVLNDEFDQAERRIEIIGGIEGNITYLSAVTPVYLETVSPIIYLIENDSADFTLKCPSQLMSLEGSIRRLTDTYKLPGKDYNINYI